MSKKACNCKKAEECEECPEWIFTFADLVMLMMGFFVILWVLKPQPGNPSSGKGDQSWMHVVGAIREAFGYIPDANSKDPIDQMMIIKGLSRMRQNGPGEGAKTMIQKSVEGPDQEVTNIRPALDATEGGRLVFAPGSSDLSSDAKGCLDEIADIVRGHRDIIMIKGHTSLDDLPQDATAEQKMELSLKRAEAAAAYLATKGQVDPELLRVQGCSTFEPLIQRQYTIDAQSLNRRIEVVTTGTLVDEYRPKPTTDDSNGIP